MKRFVLVIVLTAVLGFTTFTHAALVEYQFSGTVTSINTGLSGFPSILAGIQPGDSLSGSYSYNGATSPSTNPFSGTPGAATFYQVPNTFSLAINNVSIPIGGSNLVVFVWNNEPLLSDKDGYKVQNTFNQGLPYYLNFGNIALPSNTFSDESLPTTSFGPTVFGIYNSTLNGTYLTGNTGMLFATNPVPIPAAVWLLGSGLIGLVGLRRKFTK